MHESKSELDPGAICEVLQRYEVDCVVIGGVAAVLRGAPYQTFDLDMVPADEPSNLKRLTDALVDMEAEVLFAGPVLRFADGDWLHASKIWNFDTKYGRFDVLFVPSGSGGYSSLIAGARRAEVADGVTPFVASIEDLIAMKESAGRAKDDNLLPILRYLRDRGAEPPPA